jgi:hypothetical protein
VASRLEQPFGTVVPRISTVFVLAAAPVVAGMHAGPCAYDKWLLRKTKQQAKIPQIILLGITPNAFLCAARGAEFRSAAIHVSFIGNLFSLVRAPKFAVMARSPRAILRLNW